MTGHVKPSPALDSDQDTQLLIDVSRNKGPVETFDAGAPPGRVIDFDCGGGDTYSVVQTDDNTSGSSPVSAPVTGIAAVGPPPRGPAVPGVPQVWFTDP